MVPRGVCLYAFAARRLHVVQPLFVEPNNRSSRREATDLQAHLSDMAASSSASASADDRVLAVDHCDGILNVIAMNVERLRGVMYFFRNLVDLSLSKRSTKRLAAFASGNQTSKTVTESMSSKSA